MKLKRGIAVRLANLCCAVILVYCWLNLILSWNGIPESIPGHYNAAGVADRWGSRMELWILPAVTTVFYIGISIVERFPGIWNTGVEVTEENRERVYGVLLFMITAMKLLLCADFTVMSGYQIRQENLPVWFLPVFLVLTFAVVVGPIIRLNQVK